MEIEKLIERLQNWDGIKPDREIDCAIEGLKALQAENDRLKKEAQQMRWIPVEERLPDGDEQVLVFSLDEDFGTTQHELARRRYRARTGWDWYVYSDEYGEWILNFNRVTHWMPLPPGPLAKGEE